MFGRNRKGEQKQQKDAQKEIEKRRLIGKHMAGLPIAQDAICVITFEEECVSFLSGGNTFNLGYPKITAMSFKTSTEIEKAYVSNVGGAIAGAALFGPLGAIVGGRAKEKKTKKIQDFIIFTFLKDGNIDYLSFEIEDLCKAIKLIERYKPRIAQQGTITEL